MTVDLARVRLILFRDRVPHPITKWGVTQGAVRSDARIEQTAKEADDQSSSRLSLDFRKAHDQIVAIQVYRFRKAFSVVP